MTAAHRAALAVARRDFAITRSYRTAFVLDLFFGIVNLVVFYYISRAVDLRAGRLDGASTYFEFAAAGIALTVVMQAATTGLARRIREEQLTGTLEILAMQPIGSASLACGLTGFPFFFGVVRAAVYILFAAAFLGLDMASADVVGFVLMLAATGVALSALGIVLGAIVLVLKQGEALAAVVTFGLTLLGGALFPRDLLPGWLQVLGDVLPIRFAVDGLRAALFEGGNWRDDFAALAVTSLVLVPAGIAFFAGILRVVKARGSLSQY